MKQQVGLTTIEISYARPSAKGRKVFGELVPFGATWRTGANNATTISFNTDVNFGGTKVPAGTYALFTIPDQKEWTIILNKNTKQWGSYGYEAKDDVARVKVSPVALSEPVETFTMEVNDLRDESATLNLTWEKTRVPVKLEFDVVAKVVEQVEAAMSAPTKPTPREYFQAAVFYLDHDLDLKKATEWMDAALAGQPDAFYMHYHKARLLAKTGDKAGARAASEKSIELAKKAGGAVAEEYVRLNGKLAASLGQ